MDFTPKFTTIVDLFEASVTTFGGNKAFGYKVENEWTFISYVQLKEQVDAFRAGLASLGIKKGDRVALIANNQLRWAITSYACMGLGAVLVPMYESQLEKDWLYILKDCKATALLVANHELYRKTREYPDVVPSLRHVIQLNAPIGDPHSFDKLLSDHRGSPLEPTFPKDSDTAFLIYTSGTTGNPKGVVLSHLNIASNVSSLMELFDFKPGDISLSFLPWAHCFGLTAELHCLMGMGATVAINTSTDKLLDELREIRPTVLVSVPRIFNRIYEGVNRQILERPTAIQKLFQEGLRTSAKLKAGEKLSLVDRAAYTLANRLVFAKIKEKFGGRLRFAISGGAALCKDVAEFIDSLDITVYEGYGLTETSPVIAVNYPNHRRLGSVGKTVPGSRLVIDTSIGDDSGRGELIAYGPNVTRGYNNADDDQGAILADGGFRTGDMGYIDDDGYVHITGRIKEQYKLENGKYVVPAPLEEALALSPFISGAFVYGNDRPYNVALIAPDFASLNTWATENGITDRSPEALVKNFRVIEKLRQEIDLASKDLKGYERVRKFALLSEEFTVHNAMLTPKLSLRRKNIMERYGTRLDSLYRD